MWSGTELINTDVQSENPLQMKISKAKRLELLEKKEQHEKKILNNA